MELGRALVSLEIGLACKLFVAAVDAARPHGGVGGFLRGGSVLVLRLFLVGLPLLVGLRSDWDWPIQRTNATTMGYALSALFVGPSRFRLAQISQCQSTASSVSRWLRERWLMIPGDLGRGVRWQLLWAALVCPQITVPYTCTNRSCNQPPTTTPSSSFSSSSDEPTEAGPSM